MVSESCCFNFRLILIISLQTDEVQPYVDATKLSTIRLKLEEKRRHIEAEKRKLEAAVSKYQQKVGKAAFLQAINKVRGTSGAFVYPIIVSSFISKPFY